MAAKIYGIFSGGKWGMTTSKREAMKIARNTKGEVRHLNAKGAAQYWDMPTFYASSNPVADFRDPAPLNDVRPIGPAACPDRHAKFDPPATPARLARAFSKVLRSWLTEEQMDEVLKRNAAEPAGSGICHSHDFCDANQAMIDAIEEIEPGFGEDGFDAGCDEQARWCDEAWAIAKAAGFRPLMIGGEK